MEFNYKKLTFLEMLDRGYGMNDEKQEVKYDEIQLMMKTLENEVNNFSYNPVKAVEEFKTNLKPNDNYALGVLSRIALVWVNFYGGAYGRGNLLGGRYLISVDGRNEIAIGRCEEIRRIPEFQELCDLYDIGNIDFLNYYKEGYYMNCYYKAFMQFSINMHKTLMQTATKLFLYSFETQKNYEMFAKLTDKIKEEYGEEFWRLPLI